MATNAQIRFIGQLLYHGGCGFHLADTYSQLANDLSNKEAGFVISHIQKNGIKYLNIPESDTNYDVYRELLKGQLKCRTCKADISKGGQKGCHCD